MKRQLLSTTLLVAALLSLGWWLREIMTPPAEIQRASTENPDYYADNLKVSAYGMDGRLEQTLETPRMEHFESTATATLIDPVLWRYNPNTPPWRMQAEKAYAYHDRDTIVMPGEVIMDRQGNAAAPPYHIVTRDLTVETQTGHATTDAPIRVESNQQWIEAIGMEGWLKAPVKIHLLSQVRGQYVFE